MTQRQTPRFPDLNIFSSTSSYQQQTSNPSSYRHLNQTYDSSDNLVRVKTDPVTYVPEPTHSSKYKQQRYQTKAQQNCSMKPRFSHNDLEDLIQKQIQSSKISKPQETPAEPVYEKITPEKRRVTSNRDSISSLKGQRTNVPPIRGLSALEAICSGSSEPKRMNRRNPVRGAGQPHSEILSPTRSPTSRISKASQSIYEQYNESLQCTPLKDPKLVKQLENSSMSLFAGIVENLEDEENNNIAESKALKDWKFYQRSYSTSLINNDWESSSSNGKDKTIEACKSLINLKFKAPSKNKLTNILRTSTKAATANPRMQRPKSSAEDDSCSINNSRSIYPTMSILEDEEEDEFDGGDLKVNMMMIVNQTFEVNNNNKVETPPGSTSTDDSIKKQSAIESPLSPRNIKKVEKKSESVQVNLIDIPKYQQQRNIVKEILLKPIKEALGQSVQERLAAPLKVEVSLEEFATPKKERGPITPSVTMSPEKAKTVVAKKGFQSKINGNYYLNKNLSMTSFPTPVKTNKSVKTGEAKLKVTQTPKINVNSKMSFTQGYLSCKI